MANSNPVGTLYNALTESSKIIGTIVSENDIRVDGIIEGDVQCKGKVVIGKAGLIKGTLQCRNAEILGHLDGKLTVTELLTLRTNGQIDGEVNTHTLMVEPGAVFNGTCAMKKPAQK